MGRSTISAGFYESVADWVTRERAVQSAVLFGSSARSEGGPAEADAWSDLDLHLVTTNAARLERVDWAKAIPGQGFCFQGVKPATGGVRKVTALFASGQIDLVLVPLGKMRWLRTGMKQGGHRAPGALRATLNEMSTCLRSGFRFIKGEERWGEFYAEVAENMPGVRLSDAEAQQRAAVALCDALWVLQKIERGEFSAAQHLLHRSLAETNFALVRELRLRRGEPLPSFGLGRRVETLLSARELAWVRVSAAAERNPLRQAVRRSLRGLAALMAALVPGWRVPAPLAALLKNAGA